MIWLSLILTGISAIAKGFCDSIKFQDSFPFRDNWWLGKGEHAWNNRTWLNKYLLSMFSDAWHMFDFIRIVSMLLAIVVCPIELQNWLMILGLTVLGYIWHGIVFEITYKIL